MPLFVSTKLFAMFFMCYFTFCLNGLFRTDFTNIKL